MVVLVHGTVNLKDSQPMHKAMKTYSQFIAEASAKGQLQDFEHGIKRGDIYYYAWGYDKTIIHWYQVTNVTKSSAEFIRIEDKKSSDGSVAKTGTSVPLPNKSINKPSITRKILKRGGRNYIKMDDGSLEKWDGKPKRYD